MLLRHILPEFDRFYSRKNSFFGLWNKRDHGTVGRIEGHDGLSLSQIFKLKNRKIHMNNNDFILRNNRRDGINRGGFLKCGGDNCPAKPCSSACGKPGFKKLGNESAKASGQLLFLSGFLFLFGAATAFACPATTGYAPTGQNDKALTVQVARGNLVVGPDYYQSSNNPFRGD